MNVQRSFIHNSQELEIIQMSFNGRIVKLQYIYPYYVASMPCLVCISILSNTTIILVIINKCNNLGEFSENYAELHIMLFLLYNIPEIMKLQERRIDQWLPGIKNVAWKGIWEGSEHGYKRTTCGILVVTEMF